jgi:ceramide glucosyltransferase
VSFVVDTLLVVSALRGASALRNQRAFWREVRGGLERAIGSYAPKATIVAPVKGVDPDFAATIGGLFRQRYDNAYELLFVAEAEDDPAVATVRAALAAARDAGELRASRTEVLIAGPARDRGQKVHNQLVALAAAASDSEVFAFVDSDGRPAPTWLASLVAPLADETVGATTGFRWYVPLRGGSASSLVSLWNAMSVALVGKKRQAFAWGGSMALRRRTFVEVDIAKQWRGSVSDDLGVTLAVKAAGRSIAFVPRCLVPSFHDFGLASGWEFVLRQFVILRRYVPRVHALGLVATALSVAGFLGGLGAVAVSLVRGEVPALTLALLALVYGLTVLLGLERWRGIRAVLPQHEGALRSTRAMLLFGTPLGWLLNFAALSVAAFRRRILWRGIGYDLVAPDRVVVTR